MPAQLELIFNGDGDPPLSKKTGVDLLKVQR